MSEIRLQVVPDTFIHDRVPPSDEPYMRVVNIDAGGGPLVLQGPTPAQTETIKFDANYVFAERLQTFAERFLTGRGKIPYSASDTLYNCFLFTDNVQRGAARPTDNPVEAKQTMHNIMKQEHRAGRRALPLGAAVVVAELDAARPVHAAVSLGLHVPFLLQVMASNGYLGLQPLDAAVGYYQKRHGTDSIRPTGNIRAYAS